MNNYSLISNILQGTSETIIALDLNGRVLFWNNAAEKLFGYKKEEVLNKILPIISKQSLFELEHVIKKTKERQQIQFRTQKKNKDGDILDLIFVANPILNEKQEAIGISILIRQTESYKKFSYLPLNMTPIVREQKRTFIEIRKIILATITAKKTINQIANDSGINWRTVEKHLTFLIGKKLVKEVFSSEYVRIFELTELGSIYIEKIKQEERNKILR